MLSWNPLRRVEVKQKSDALCKSMLSDTPTPTMHVKTITVQGKLHFNYDGNKEFGKIFNLLQSVNALINDNVRINNLLCISKKDQEMVLKTYHDDEGHPRANKLAEQVVKTFHWNTLCVDCKQYVETC
jgi:Integrase zinc binding domain